MLVPNKAEHKANVEELMNYYYDPVDAAKLAAWNNYICPVRAPRRRWRRSTESAADSPLIFPDDETLQEGHQFMAAERGAGRATYQQQFNQVIGG